MKRLFSKKRLSQIPRFRLRTLQSQRLARSTPDAGLTLLECIVAIVVVGITGALITPPLFLAAATRYQNQRAEQALQLAQGEVDRIRTLVSKGQHFPEDLPGIAAVGANQGLQFYAPGTAIASQLKSVNDGCANLYNEEPVTPETFLPIDVDGDCEDDFLLQIFRTAGTTSAQEAATGARNRPTSFELGVRVYASLARENVGNLYTENGQVIPASLKFTSGEGSQRDRPLAVVYTNITWSDTEFSLCQYHGDCP